MWLYTYIKSKKGVTPTGAIIAIVVVTLLVLFGMQAGKPYLSSMSVNSELKVIVKQGLNKNDNQLRKIIRGNIKERGFKFKDSDIKIIRGFENESLTIKVKYTYDLKLPYYEKTLIFENIAEHYLPGSAGSRAATIEKQKKTKSIIDKLKGFFGF